MKNMLLFCLISFVGLSAGWTQCDTTYITTNPDAPFNPENPAKLNTFFDWRNQEFDLYYTVNGVAITTTIPSPFYQLSNYGVLHLYQSEDFRPEDGWELIGRDLGYFDNGSPRSDLTNPYFILYNKYTGLMRVFLAIGQREQDYDAIEFRVSFVGATGGVRTSLLDYADIPLNAVQVMDTSFKYMVATSEFLQEEKKWMMAEFQMAYDPCTCENPSTLLIDGYLTDTAYVSISGQSFGTIQPISMVNGKPKQQQLDVNAAYKKTKDAITAGTKIHKSLSQLIGKLDTTNTSIPPQPGSLKVSSKSKTGVESIALELLNDDFLKKGLKYIPYIGEAIEILSVFASGGKKDVTPQTVTLSPLSTTSTHTFSGHITSSKPYKQITINTPGSNWPSGQGDLYPYYDEVLGMFNLLKEPIVEVRTYGDMVYDGEYGLWSENFYHHQVELSEDISFVLNPAVFDTSQVEVTGSFFLTVEPNCLSWTQSPLIHVRGNTYRTPFLPISCLKDLIVDFPVDTVGGFSTTCSPSSVQLQIAAHLRPLGNDPNRQDVLFSGLYQVKTLRPKFITPNGGAYPVLPTNPLPNLLGENVILAQTPLEGGKTYYATESFTLGSGVTVTGTGQVVLVAGREITVLPNATLNPGITLETGQPTLCNRVIYPARQPEISSICSSNQYQGRTSIPRNPAPAEEDLPSPPSKSPLSAYPNPFTQDLTLAFSLDQPGTTSARLIDHLGREVMQLWENQSAEAGAQEHTFNLSSLPAGLYLAVLETSQGRQTVRIVKE